MADSRIYNARVTTEALEKKFRDTFPSQAGAELVDDLYASGVIVPVVDFSSAAEGSGLRSDLQRAWDFSTGYRQVRNSAATVSLNPGFWQLQVNISALDSAASVDEAKIRINDGASNKDIFVFSELGGSGADFETTALTELVIFLRSGDTLRLQSTSNNIIADVFYRQIADVSGNLVNPLGFTSS